MSSFPGFEILQVYTFYLELHLSDYNRLVTPRPNYSIVKADIVKLDDYLCLYKEIGKEWGWSKRLVMNSIELTKHLEQESITVYWFYQHDERIGFAELEQLDEKSKEIIYFGFKNEFISKGLGTEFMHQILQLSKSDCSRICLTTCQYDHPSALGFYTKLGFKIYNEKRVESLYPETFLTK